MTEAERTCRRCKKRLLTAYFTNRKWICNACSVLLVKKCSRCRKLLPITKFPTSPSNPSGRYAYCRSCRSEVYHREDGHKKQRAYQLRRQFGLTPEDYTALTEAQNNCCWICGKLAGTRRLNVDHDHKMGNVREAVNGLVCPQCNQAMGGLQDCPYLLHRAAQFKLIKPAQKILTSVDS